LLGGVVLMVVWLPWGKEAGVSSVAGAGAEPEAGGEITDPAVAAEGVDPAEAAQGVASTSSEK
ncbi:hypothetical protein JHN63_50205, partial [Streptomyces sp. MBT65]|uniref:hypothetical protein n=1 Tax=Streptomyces sp. MBT65 TaxID=1488395 RepID=UPI001909BB52